MEGQAEDAALIDQIVAVDRRIAAAEAERAVLMDRFVALRRNERVPEVAARRARVLAGQFAVDEIAVAICWSRARVEAEVARVRLLRRSLPTIFARWTAGELDGYRTTVLTDTAVRLVRPGSLDKLDEQAGKLAVARTATQLRSWCSRFVARTEPDQAERRHSRALADRRVETRVENDGMGSAWALLNAPDLAAIDARLTTLARALGTDDPRSMDQRRADLFADQLLGRQGEGSGGGGAAVAITVPLQSLLGLTDGPGELSDRSAGVPASLVRQIAARPDTLFHRVLTDAAGHVLDVTELGRFPSDRLGFAIDLRDGSCRWPTCTGRASDCDANHDPPWPEGGTRADDLVDVCRRHHNGHTHGGFKVRHQGHGLVEWTTPSGHTYLSEADPVPTDTWWPLGRETPCPCDACDRPELGADEIAAALPPDTGIEDLSDAELRTLLDAA